MRAAYPALASATLSAASLYGRGCRATRRANAPATAPIGPNTTQSRSDPTYRSVRVVRRDQSQRADKAEHGPDDAEKNGKPVAAFAACAAVIPHARMLACMSCPAKAGTSTCQERTIDEEGDDSGAAHATRRSRSSPVTQPSDDMVAHGNQQISAQLEGWNASSHLWTHGAEASAIAYSFAKLERYYPANSRFGEIKLLQGIYAPMSMDIVADGKGLKNLTKINVLIGKNGSGKSTLLRHFDARKNKLPNIGTVRYVTPERGGELVYEGGVETNVLQNPGWGDDVRRKNRFYNFQPLSIAEFRRLENLVLRKIESDPQARSDLDFTFETTLASINELLG